MGILDCFNFGDIVNTAAMNISVKASAWVIALSFLLDNISGVELLGYIVSLCLTFKGCQTVITKCLEYCIFSLQCAINCFLKKQREKYSFLFIHLFSFYGAPYFFL